MFPLTLDEAFGIAGRLAMLGWLSLILLPRWRGVSRLLAGLAIPALLSLGYLVLILVHWHAAPGGFGSLSAVMALFTSPAIALAGWVHYLAFDMLVGNAVLRRSQERRIPHLLMVPVLLATFLFGPIGLLLYLLLERVFAAGRRDPVLPPALVPRWWPARPALDPVLAAAALAIAALAIPTALASLGDARQLGGDPIWLKPLKFEIALALYLATLALFLPLAGEAFRRSLAGRFVVWGAVVPSLLEVAYIGIRASRGEASHYNIGDPVAAGLYAAMGVGAILLTIASPVLAWGLTRRAAVPLPPVVRWSLVVGLVLTFVLGAGEGAFMSSSRTGHFVGTVPAEHATMALTGWSLAIGDLRVAHFLGLHALHALPLAGLAIWLATRDRALGLAALGVVTLAYGGTAIAAFLAAVAGRPLLGL